VNFESEKTAKLLAWHTMGYQSENEVLPQCRTLLHFPPRHYPGRFDGYDLSLFSGIEKGTPNETAAKLGKRDP
jgi:hypothetical protein